MYSIGQNLSLDPHSVKGKAPPNTTRINQKKQENKWKTHNPRIPPGPSAPRYGRVTAALRPRYSCAAAFTAIVATLLNGCYSSRRAALRLRSVPEVVGTRGGGAVGGGARDPDVILEYSSVHDLSMSSILSGEELPKLLFELYEKKHDKNENLFSWD